MKNLKKCLAVLMMAAMVLALAACGSKAPASSTNTDSGSTVSAAGTKIAEIQARGKLILLTNATFPPFEYATVDGYDGVDIQLGKMIAEKLGVELEVMDMDFDGLTAALNSGKGDLIAAGFSATPERAAEVNFSVPYVDSNIMLIVPVGSDINSADQLAGLTVAVQQGTTSDLYVQDNLTDSEVLQFKDALQAGNAVMNGQADVAIIDKLTGENVVANSGGKLEMIETPLQTEQYVMAVAKNGSEDLLAVIDEVLGEAVAQDLVTPMIAHHMEASQNI